MAGSSEQIEKLDNLMDQADALGIDGLFTDNCLSAEEMAHKMWELGYIKSPSFEDLISEIESHIEKLRLEKEKNQENFIRLWTAAGKAKNYNKASWLDVERQLFNSGVI